MDKQTPTQIATQSMKGCGKTFMWIYSIQDRRICGRIEDLKHSGVILCDKCQERRYAYKLCWENELEFLDWLDEDHRTDYKLPVWAKGSIKDRISELTSALKILNGDKQ